ncbi:hypothetical protein ACH4L5_22145 [Streptomyces sp. NPDC017405]|uniref:allene oxide cyclase barrel-like domain-containing protein n=1 Tax=unclassified Streptomyces TaxID=2593676 RepID=UPI0037941255
MSVRTSLLRSVAVTASVAALLGLSAATGHTTDASATAHTGKPAGNKETCVSRVLSEPQIKNLQNVDVAEPRVGQIGIYHDELRDAKDTYAGTLMGRYEIRKTRPGGPVLTYYTEDLFLPDGVVHAEGWVDFNDVKNTRWVGYRAVGLDGVYQGKTGKREWRNTGVDGAPADARWRLCG